MGSPRYSKEFKADAVRVFKSGNKPIGQLSKELGVTTNSIRVWAREADADAGVGAAGVLTTPEREEMAALRKRCRNLEKERDFLVQAAAYFAKTKK